MPSRGDGTCDEEEELFDLDELLTSFVPCGRGCYVLTEGTGSVYELKGKSARNLARLDAMLTGILRAEDGQLVVWGEDGFVARGQGRSWAPLPNLGENELLVLGEGGYLARIGAGGRSSIKAPKVDFYRAAPLGANLWLGAGDDGLFTLAGGKLTRVKKNVYSFSLHAGDDQLVIGGRNEIVSTRDGKEFPCVEIQRGFEDD